MITLGIETSCDETSASLLRDGTIITNSIYTQVEHALYGGIVPEVASRAHLEKIDHLINGVFKETSISPREVDLIAVTDSPGLAGALLVGISYALGLHLSLKIPVTGINHLEGHICSVFLEHPNLEFPFLALAVSGGHTAIYLVEKFGSYRCLGKTVDDAAGEAFDKVGKLLGFSYPAGRTIECEAAMATEPTGQPLQFPIAKISAGGLDFSFSGLKTAVKYFLSNKDPDFIAANRPTICKAFQTAVINSLANNLVAASEQTGIKNIVLVGGVACNGALRTELKRRFLDNVFFPPPHLCTDNAAMIAYAGWKRYQLNQLRFPHMNPASGIES